jgi:hypothetical protein
MTGPAWEDSPTRWRIFLNGIMIDDGLTEGHARRWAGELCGAAIARSYIRPSKWTERAETARDAITSGKGTVAVISTYGIAIEEYTP